VISTRLIATNITTVRVAGVSEISVRLTVRRIHIRDIAAEIHLLIGTFALGGIGSTLLASMFLPDVTLGSLVVSLGSKSSEHLSDRPSLDCCRIPTNEHHNIDDIQTYDTTQLSFSCSRCNHIVPDAIILHQTTHKSKPKMKIKDIHKSYTQLTVCVLRIFRHSEAPLLRTKTVPCCV